MAPGAWGHGHAPGRVAQAWRCGSLRVSFSKIKQVFKTTRLCLQIRPSSYQEPSTPLAASGGLVGRGEDATAAATAGRQTQRWGSRS